MIPVLAIARATITELRRQKVLIIPLIGVVLSLLALVGGLVIEDRSLELERRAAESAAWAVGSAAAFGGALYALIVGSSLIARELSDGTMLMLAARPIGRWQVVLGRLLGAAAFILATLVVTCLVYGLVASIVTGMTAPIDEPLRALGVGLPAVLLALCVGVAFSIQGRAVAAVGSAVIVSAFAAGLAAYVDGWKVENHQRSFLVDAAQDRLPANDPLIGTASAAVVHLMPYGVFIRHATDEFAEHVDESIDLDSGTIDVRSRGGYAGLDYDAARASPSSSDLSRDQLEQRDQRITECIELSGDASCFFGDGDAWSQARIPARPDLYDGWDLVWAWLAIPAWIGISVLLLTRRRDLA